MIPEGTKVLWEIPDPRGSCYANILNEGWIAPMRFVPSMYRDNKHVACVTKSPSVACLTNHDCFVMPVHQLVY
jgi:hypothetical protein